MPVPMPDPGSDGELPPGGAAGPEAEPEPGSLAAAGLPPGLDYQALLEALAASGALDTDPDNQEAVIAEREAAEAEGRMLACDPAVIAAGVVEFMDPGPAQAGWLEVAAAARAGWMRAAWPGWRSRRGGWGRGRRRASWARWRRSRRGPRRLTGGSGWSRTGGRCGCAGMRSGRCSWR